MADDNDDASTLFVPAIEYSQSSYTIQTWLLNIYVFPALVYVCWFFRPLVYYTEVKKSNSR